MNDDRYDELCAEYFSEYDSSWTCVDDSVDGSFFDWWEGMLENEPFLDLILEQCVMQELVDLLLGD